MAWCEWELTFQVILANFYRPAFIVWNNCNVKQSSVSREETVPGVCSEGQRPGPCHSVTHIITYILLYINKMSLLLLDPSLLRVVLRWVQQRHSMAGCCKDICENGRNWTNCLHPHIVLKEQILLILVQTRHSLVLAGVIRCNWITAFWRITDALLIDSLYSELVGLSFSKTQHRVSAGSHRLVVAWDPVLWASNTPRMRHSPCRAFMAFPQQDHEVFLLSDEHTDLSM